jgi:hypothetical protein
VSAQATIPHGTVNSYRRRLCRCPECRNAWREYQAEYRDRTGYRRLHVDRSGLADLLDELFPEGLTADSPRGRARLERMSA